ncbi:MAG: bifunctional demethylmenaquinone methyltransferase/2-methoxy-6-polyprenyl-1,4-benzoquinol methylase UbiE [Devosiaceae bacterium]|nr:bifunctional demethylmenaquinone methyltransferase/2-methoxy-6-polyprenyl-1,4-benzoquinol methylase UbiE [Devosiaceae bacterium MH13]
MTDIGNTFGDRTISVEDKQPLVDDVFHKVASRYDLMNDLMSGFLHRLWKDAMVTKVRPRKSGKPFKAIDVAGGTGDIAFRLVDAARGNAQVDVVDINASMLDVGRERAIKRGLEEKVSFHEGNAEALEQPDGAYEAYTIAFGIRNVPRIDLALSEAYRVLRFGGRFACLEFSKVDVPGFDAVYNAYSDAVIPKLGSMVAGDEDSYRYLVESIRQFPNKARFAAMIEDAGFKRVETISYSGGIAVLHTGVKL